MKSYRGKIPNRHVRDFQRNTVYGAESKCSFWNNFSIISTEDVHTLISDISKTFGVNDLLLVSGTEPIHATQSKIVLPFPIAQSKPVICHEMSHVINYQLGPADHHGPNFAKVYLEVVHEFIGEEEYQELKNQFDLLGVLYEEVVLV